MNAALLIGAAAVVVSIVVMEARRKLRDWQFARDRDWIVAMAHAHRVPRGPVWMGYDHGSGDYTGSIGCAAGNAGDVSTPDAGCGGGGDA